MKSIFNRISSYSIPILFGLFLSLSGVEAQTVSFTTKDSNIPCLDKKFTVVAHIFLDSLTQMSPIDEAEIEAVMAGVNELFQPMCASFEICEYKYSPYFQFDTLYSEAWIYDLEQRFMVRNHINIFFVGSDKAPEPDFCGRATFGGIGIHEAGFIAVERPCLTEFSLARHLGTYFGLYPTNHGDDLVELVNETNCLTTGDSICDTPADPWGKAPSGGPYFLEKSDPDDSGKTCLFILNDVDANGEYYQPDMGNIMSFYDHCWCGFSKQQYIRMAENYLSTLKKKW